ncbi:MMPL family transporter [Acrocarpospora corrugata]|uniref:MMPL family transporter n=1 Tax=Acrocarpospora corrugata TaxID=35763 RepID=UPI001FED00B6|nr:MMPL family transporter [Acrocarpospora corrugata]
MCAALSALTFLPAVLVLLDRAALWPAKPYRAEASGIWRRVAALVDQHPLRLWIGTVLPPSGSLFSRRS